MTAIGFSSAVLLTIYIVGFVFSMAVHRRLPVTPGLALLRSALWPIYLTTGWPHGQWLPMD